MAKPWSGATWMGDMHSTIADQPLSNIILPGSHDACAFKLFPTELAPFAPSQAKSCVAKRCCCCIPLNFSIAQTGDLHDQLSAGSRYLDMRIAFDNNQQLLRTEHSLYGLPIKELLEQVARFINQESSEIVILHLRHFSVAHHYDMTDEHHASLVQLVQETLNVEYFIRHDERHLSIQALKDKDRRIMLVYGTDACAQVNETDWIHSESIVIPKGVGWLNSQTTEHMVAAMNNLAQRASPTNNGFHKMAPAITPNDQLIKAGVINCICCCICRLLCAHTCKAPAGLKEVSDVVSDALLHEIPTMVAQGKRFNILDMDHIVRQQKRNRLIETVALLNGRQCQHHHHQVVGDTKMVVLEQEPTGHAK